LKGKITSIPLETILKIPNELEYLKGLVKLARRHKDEKAKQFAHVAVVSVLPIIKQICINKNHRGKTLHLTIEIQNGLIEGLMDIGAYMLVMVAGIVRELRIMHMVFGTENYKTMSGIVTKALGRIIDLLVKVGNIQCSMVFLIMYTDSDDILLGLDFLMKIKTIVDVEKVLSRYITV
jgi:hypothetical protein